MCMQLIDLIYQAIQSIPKPLDQICFLLLQTNPKKHHLPQNFPDQVQQVILLKEIRTKINLLGWLYMH